MLDQELHFLLLRAFHHSNRLITQQIAVLGLYPGQPKILEYLLEHDGCIARDICRDPKRVDGHPQDKEPVPRCKMFHFVSSSKFCVTVFSSRTSWDCSSGDRFRAARASVWRKISLACSAKARPSSVSRRKDARLSWPFSFLTISPWRSIRPNRLVMVDLSNTQWPLLPRAPWELPRSPVSPMC